MELFAPLYHDPFLIVPQTFKQAVLAFWTEVLQRDAALLVEPSRHGLTLATVIRMTDLLGRTSLQIKSGGTSHDDAPDRSTVAVNSKLRLYFRPVTSTACHIETTEVLGRQPEIELDTDAVRKMAPKKVSIDHVKGAWRGSYSL